jgi:acyl-CoA thioester hydrolase
MAGMDAVWTAPVRYAECDQQGIVFNAHYLAYADEAMNGWYVATGNPYPALIARGLDTRVVASALEWKAPARWGDVVAVDVVTERIGTSSFTLVSTVRVDERTCCTVRTTYVLTDSAGRPTPVPDDLRAAWTAPAPGG